MSGTGWRRGEVPLLVLLPVLVVVGVATLYVAGTAGVFGVVVAAAVIVGGVGVAVLWSPVPHRDVEAEPHD